MTRILAQASLLGMLLIPASFGQVRGGTAPSEPKGTAVQHSNAADGATAQHPTDPNNPPATVNPFTKEPIKQHPAKKFMDKLGRHFIIATELSLTKNFFIRIGFNYKMRKELSLSEKQGIAGFSGGIGFKVSKFSFSYSYAQVSAVYAMNSLTLSTNLSSFVKPDKPVVTP